jgi:hypothetical protein
MASIDRIYGTAQEFNEFKEWLKQNKPEAIKYLYYPDDDTWETYWNDGRQHPMSSFPEDIDKWLYYNCPLEYITERIFEQYNGEF